MLQRLFAAVSVVMMCASVSGCRHSPAAAAGVIHLQDNAIYPLLLPSGSAAPTGTMQTVTLRLGTPAASGCSIAGDTFALTAPASGDVWTMRSPSASGWQDASTTGDFRDAWITFVHQLAAHVQQGCFPGSMSPLPAITEAIAVPADEAVLFRYAFTGRGSTELRPGMVIEAEHSYLRPKNGKRELTSAVARYHVVTAAAGGVSLRRTFVENQKLAGEQSILFHLHERTAGAAHIRLFLQGVAEGNAQHASLLLFGNDPSALDRASSAVEAATTLDCKAAAVESSVQCLSVDAAVSLLIEFRVDGKAVVQPLGTTLAQYLYNKPELIATVKLRRRLSNGAWDVVDFPRTPQVAGRLVLLDGDELTMK